LPVLEKQIWGNGIGGSVVESQLGTGTETLR
jgi:hypothetical protein